MTEEKQEEAKMTPEQSVKISAEETDPIKRDDIPDTPSGEEDGILDVIADFFKLMTLGIIKFAFWKVPLFIWLQLKKFFLWLRKYLYSVGRAIFWFLVWILIVFAAWIAFGLRQFLRFWSWIGRILANMGSAIWHFLIENAGPIWFVIAIIGSVYGLLYVTLKRRAQKKNIPFYGVFTFLKHRTQPRDGESKPLRQWISSFLRKKRENGQRQ